MLRRINKVLFLTTAVFSAVFLLSGCNLNSESSSDNYVSMDKAADTCTKMIDDQKSEICIDYIDGNEDIFCKDYCIENINDKLTDIGENEIQTFDDLQDKIKKQQELVEEQQDKIKKQQDTIDTYTEYFDCIERWTDIHGFINPDDADHCKRLYQP